MSDLKDLHRVLADELRALSGQNIEIMFAGFVIDERVIAKVISPIAHMISRFDLVSGPMSKRSPGFLSYYLKDRLNFNEENCPPVVNRSIWVHPLKESDRSGIFHSKFLFIFVRDQKSKKRNLKALFLGSMNWSRYHFSKDRKVLESFIKIDLGRTTGVERLLELNEFADTEPVSRNIETEAKIIEFRSEKSDIVISVLKRDALKIASDNVDIIAAPFITKGGVRLLLKSWTPPEGPKIYGPKAKHFRLHGKFIIGKKDSFIIFGSANITESALDGINHETIYYKNNPGSLKELRFHLGKLEEWDQTDSMETESDDSDVLSGELNLPKTCDGYIREAKLIRDNEQLILKIQFNGKKIKTKQLKLQAGKLDGTLECNLTELPHKVSPGEIQITLPLQNKTHSDNIKNILKKSLSNGVLYISMINENYHIPVDLGEFWIGPANLAPAQQVINDSNGTKNKKITQNTDGPDINWNGTDIRPLRILAKKISNDFRWLMKILSKNGNTEYPSWVQLWNEDPWLRNVNE